MGQVGSGKTLLATILSLSTIELDVSIQTIYANYEIYHPSYQQFFIEQFLKKEYQNGVIVMDEVYNYLESRSFLNPEIVKLTHTLFQIRKKGLHSISTAPLVSSIDVRLREMLDFLIIARKMQNGFEYDIYAKNRNILGAKFEYSKTLFISIEQAKPYFERYDTLEIVNDSISTISSDDRYLEIANEYKEKAKAYFTDKKLTHSTLKLYLMQNKLNKACEKYLYELLQ